MQSHITRCHPKPDIVILHLTKDLSDHQFKILQQHLNDTGYIESWILTNTRFEIINYDVRVVDRISLLKNLGLFLQKNKIYVSGDIGYGIHINENYIYQLQAIKNMCYLYIPKKNFKKYKKYKIYLH